MRKRPADSPSGTDRREAVEDVPANEAGNTPIGDILARRYGRRDLLKGGLAVTVLGLLAPPLPVSAAGVRTGFDFTEVSGEPEFGHALAPDHDLQVLLSWGDPVLQGAPAFDPLAQTTEAQAAQFGYNNDYIAYFPLPRGSGSSSHGLLCVNHEYTNEELMFPDIGKQTPKDDFAGITPEQVGIEMAAHGASVVEVRRDAVGTWRTIPDGRFNRRITATTPMDISGPAAGHPRLRTRDDPQGRRVLGMVNNCAGGMTPWGTCLTAEENINFYFRGKLGDNHAEARNYKRLGLPAHIQDWGRYHPRFDLDQEPNEANRFGWIVEFDPYDPASAPVKRTALGRFKHEGCETILNKDGRLVVYMGDDQYFEYVYRFVSNRPLDLENQANNRDLLDDGTLSVARFDAEGTLEWLPLVFGQGPLTPANDFHSQADVLIETRRAADLSGATPMDRPEDVQPNPLRGSVYVMLTNNRMRGEDRKDAANPRGPNLYGHILELLPPDEDHAADLYRWVPLVLCGPPGNDGADWSAATSAQGWFAAPDNCAIDSQGRLWIATDQGGLAKQTKRRDGLWALETEGRPRRTGRQLFAAPVGAEVCGPTFTPDGETLFLSVQHPGDFPVDGAGNPVARTYEEPATRWPAAQDSAMPPRPSVVAIRRKAGGKVGGA